MCICLVFGGKQMLTIIAYNNIIFSKVSLGNYLLKYRSTKFELASIYENINVIIIIIIVYLEFSKIDFKNIFQQFFIFLFLLYSFYIIYYIRLLLLIAFNCYSNCSPRYLDG